MWQWERLGKGRVRTRTITFHSFIHSFIQQVFMENILWEDSGEPDVICLVPALKLRVSMGKQRNKGDGLQRGGRHEREGESLVEKEARSSCPRSTEANPDSLGPQWEGTSGIW